MFREVLPTPHSFGYGSKPPFPPQPLFPFLISLVEGLQLIPFQNSRGSSPAAWRGQPRKHPGPLHQRGSQIVRRPGYVENRQGEYPEISFPRLDPLAPGWPTSARILSFTHTPFIWIETPKRRFTTPRALTSALIDRPPSVYFLCARLGAGGREIVEWGGQGPLLVMLAWMQHLGRRLPCGP